MTWNKQQPDPASWTPLEPSGRPWPKYDPLANETLWDAGITLWDAGSTLWDYTPVIGDNWSKQ